MSSSNNPFEPAKEAAPQEKALTTKGTLKEMLSRDAFLQAVKEALPKHLRPERFVRLAIAQTTKIPHLADCTVASVIRCLMDLSAAGLEPDGRRAHLIPFKNKQKGKDGKDLIVNGRQVYAYECTLIIDYKGLADLLYRSGEVGHIHADVICKNDEFDYGYGTTAFLRHKPPIGERGEMIGAYSFVKMKDGPETFEVLSKAEIDKVRSRSKSRDNGPWVSDYAEMAKKTAFRRHSKWLPLKSETREQIEIDDSDVVEGKFEVVEPSRPIFKPAPPALPEPSEQPIDEVIGEVPEMETAEPTEDEMAREQAAQLKREAESDGGLFPTEPANAATADPGRKRR